MKTIIAILLSLACSPLAAQDFYVQQTAPGQAPCDGMECPADETWRRCYGKSDQAGKISPDSEACKRRFLPADRVWVPCYVSQGEAARCYRAGKIEVGTGRQRFRKDVPEWRQRRK